jgi:hypothetical protein
MKKAGKFYGHLVYFMALWYILCHFGIFFPFWYICFTKKYQATLVIDVYGSYLQDFLLLVIAEGVEWVDGRQDLDGHPGVNF